MSTGKFDINELKRRMQGATQSLKHELGGLRTGRASAVTIRVEEYYDRQWRDGREVLFVMGSDVLGPMGADLVPVDRAHAAKFAEDHVGVRPLPLDAVTAELLAELK